MNITFFCAVPAKTPQRDFSSIGDSIVEGSSGTEETVGEGRKEKCHESFGNLTLFGGFKQTPEKPTAVTENSPDSLIEKCAQDNTLQASPPINNFN